MTGAKKADAQRVVAWLRPRLKPALFRVGVLAAAALASFMAVMVPAEIVARRALGATILEWGGAGGNALVLFGWSWKPLLIVLALGLLAVGLHGLYGQLREQAGRDA